MDNPRIRRCEHLHPIGDYPPGPHYPLQPDSGREFCDQRRSFRTLRQPNPYNPNRYPGSRAWDDLSPRRGPWTDTLHETYPSSEQHINNTRPTTGPQGRWPALDPWQGISPTMGRVRATSSPQPQLLCPIYPCERMFDTEEDLRTHSIEAHRMEGPLPYICGHCDMGFLTHIQLEVHLHGHARRSTALSRTPGDFDDLRDRLSTMSVGPGNGGVEPEDIGNDVDVVANYEPGVSTNDSEQSSIGRYL